MEKLKDIFPDVDESKLLVALQGSDFDMEEAVNGVLNKNEKGTVIVSLYVQITYLIVQIW